MNVRPNAPINSHHPEIHPYSPATVWPAHFKTEQKAEGPKSRDQSVRDGKWCPTRTRTADLLITKKVRGLSPHYANFRHTDKNDLKTKTYIDRLYAHVSRIAPSFGPACFRIASVFLRADFQRVQNEVQNETHKAVCRRS